MSQACFNSCAHIVVGVADLAAAEALWLERFGLEPVERHEGADAELARLWGLPPDAIARQLLAATPGSSRGWLHFVEFAEPAAPVRATS